MRFDPTGQRIAYTGGYGGGGVLRILVTDAHGVSLEEFPGGHEPEWYTADTLYARSLDGADADHYGQGIDLHLRGANEGDLAAAYETYAIAPDRSNGVFAYGPEPLGHFPGTFEPSLSDGGTLALRDLASGTLRLVRLPGCDDDMPTDPTLGAGTRARWSSQTVVWDTIPFGRVYGRVTPAGPTIDLSIPGRTCTHPVALWTGTVLYVGLVLDEGDLVLCEWGSLTRHEALGWRLGTSGGSAFDWDLANSPEGPRVAWLTPQGLLATLTAPVHDAPDYLGVETPEPPDPPDPPDPPNPEPPDPPDPPHGGDDMTAADIRRYVAELSDEYLFGAIRRFHDEVVIGRDKPKDDVIPAADDSDMWTGDVFTGGANGYFTRAYISEYLIARDAGKNPLDGSVAGFDAAAKAYTAVVNPAPPITPIEPGLLQGPIGVSNRDFTVPG